MAGRRPKRRLRGHMLLLVLLLLLLLVLLLVWVRMWVWVRVLLRPVASAHLWRDPLAAVPPQNGPLALQIADLEVAEPAKQEEVVV